MRATQVNDIQRRTAYNVTAVVCKMLGDVTVDETKSRSRLTRVVTARHLMNWILYRVFKYSTTEIGTLTDKDHSTVLHSVGIVDGWLDLPNFYKREINIINHFKNMEKDYED